MSSGPADAALPHTVALFEWRVTIDDTTPGNVRAFPIFDTTQRHQSVAAFDAPGATIFPRIEGSLTPAGLYLVDLWALAPAFSMRVQLEGRQIVGIVGVSPAPGPFRVLADSGALAAGVVYQLSGFRVVLPYARVRIFNLGPAPDDVDVSILLRTD